MRKLRLIFGLLGSMVILASCSDPVREQKGKAETEGSHEEGAVSTVMEEVEALGAIDYNRHVRPILSDTCFHCHGPDAKHREGGFGIHEFDFATKELKNRKGQYGIVPGKPEESVAIELVFTEDETELMPPSDSAHKLTEKQKLILQTWVKQGAKYDEHWAFRHPVKELPEKEKNNPWVRNEIDLFVAQKHKENGLSHSPPATDEVWLRRVTHGLTGLPPTPAELAAFSGDKSTDRKEKVVDRLLASPRYGEHMAIEWLESARYADTDGYQNDHERENWPWRDYVIKSFNDNKGFDQFTIEQFAGDMLEKPTTEQIVATAYHRNHRQNGEGGALPEEYIIENVLDRVDTVGTTYFGLSMSCSRCHDHKYDPISQKEFFQFSSYFNNIKEQPIGRGINARPILKTGSLFEKKETRAARAELVVLEGKHKAEANRLKAAKAKKTSYDETKLKALTAKIAELRGKIKNSLYPQSARVMVMKEAKGIEPTYLLSRGQYTDPDTSEKLSRTVPAILLGDKAPPKDRLELAKWMMSKDNPITARVLANRIWAHHFGKGICATEEDFGSQASFPSHLKLLDWLAVEYRESGWNLKALHKKIVLSATYGQSSKVTPELLEKDRENTWLARGARFRLSGFAIRDQVLSASGLLYEKLGGASVKPYQPHGLWNSMGNNPNFFYKPSQGKDLYRRSLYTYWKRAVNPPRQLLFGAAGREVCTVKQNRASTSLQALLLMNDPTFLEAARVLAERVIGEVSGGPEERVKAIYQYATGYRGSDKKISILMESYETHKAYYLKNPEEAEKLINIGASKPSQSMDKHELAALAVVAHTVMNTDEILNQE